MCGIIGYVGTDDAVGTLLGGLANLEYRGYDSAGVAVRDSDITVCKREGDISALEAALDGRSLKGTLGVGHTRWSTHGEPSDRNAHPHTDCRGRVAVVHNGIVENHDELRGELEAAGHEFTSDTDTEVIPHLIEAARRAGDDHETAFRRAVDRLEGSFALVALFADDDRLFATREGSPLVLGLDGDEFYLASDVPAFLEHTNDVVYIEDGDVVVLSRNGPTVSSPLGENVTPDRKTVDWNPEDATKRGYDHFMLKEIHEQPHAVRQSIQGRIPDSREYVALDEFEPGEFDDVRDVQFVACGTSYHAALYARQFLLDRGIPSNVHSAGEYATNPPPLEEDTLVIGVTQSGETADTLASLRYAQAAGARTLAVTNVVGSTAAREFDDALFIRAGPEIGVAATKTFSSQVVTLALLSEVLTRDRTGSYSDQLDTLLAGLQALPDQFESLLGTNEVSHLLESYRGQDAYFFIGRAEGYPVALEGALKFKEITYEHAEGFAAGELKHGPLALVGPKTPVFAVFTGRNVEKTLGNVQEVKARGAPVIGITHQDHDKVTAVVDDVLPIPAAAPCLRGLLANVQLQLVSYHVADALGRDIDKPRNLAKSVTVE
ncbi:glutamine--fructose-6-phosphate transaminase (isomerizing) [Haloarchaeobius litoreus]|uniref:Glutamine--fructose-6-phosphate aminotransferase [isomerizing] n=1 Tax=Haloarchaeobius litoreus TaxID=755306 RepID=A0ABD6DSH8_9EURY|nr:glutamine--fructose-6-phosphate transaminase (isomerizing) [Haloarchaeobius litoreus]